MSGTLLNCWNNFTQLYSASASCPTSGGPQCPAKSFRRLHDAACDKSLGFEHSKYKQVSPLPCRADHPRVKQKRLQNQHPLFSTSFTIRQDNERLPSQAIPLIQQGSLGLFVRIFQMNCKPEPNEC